MPILTSSGMVLFKAGKKVDAAFRGVSGSDILIGFISGAEALYCNIARYNFVSDYANLNAQTKLILDEGVSSHAANFLIAYDMSQYTSRVEAESMINVNNASDEICQKEIKDKKVTDFIKRGTTQ